jgi:hypothetical protein
MLVVENRPPSHRKFTSHADVLEAMQWMVHVLRNRLNLGPEHFSARGATTLTNLIKGRNQVEGFEKYPIIAFDPNERLQEALGIANDGTDNRHSAQRLFLKNVVAVATGEMPGTDPCPTRLYAWRAEESASPGNNFEKFQSKGGQDFYTLTRTFLNDAKSRNAKQRP